MNYNALRSLTREERNIRDWLWDISLAIFIDSEVGRAERG